MTPESTQIISMTGERRKVAVIGSRGYSDYQHFTGWIKHYTANLNPCFVSGGCATGADNLIEMYAHDKGLPILIFYPDYNRHQRRAPLERNKLIIEAADVLIAFWDGKSTGTAHTIELAKKKGIQIRIVNI